MSFRVQRKLVYAEGDGEVRFYRFPARSPRKNA